MIEEDKRKERSHKMLKRSLVFIFFLGISLINFSVTAFANKINATIIENDGKKVTVSNVSFEKNYDSGSQFACFGPNRKLSGFDLSIGSIQVSIGIEKIRTVEILRSGSIVHADELKIILRDGRVFEGKAEWWYNGQCLTCKGFEGDFELKGFNAKYSMPLGELKKIIFQSDNDEIIAEVTDKKSTEPKKISNPTYVRDGNWYKHSSFSYYYIPLKIEEAGITLKVNFNKIGTVEIGHIKTKDKYNMDKTELHAIISLVDGEVL